MSDSPLILMTLRGEPVREERREPTAFAFEWLPNLFARVVAQAGGLPLFVSSECPLDDLPQILAHCDGLFLTGGEDIAPEHFDATDTVGNLVVLPARDHVELAAVTEADRLGMPILGVCRGIQVLNVARGGTLYLDLEKQYPSKPRDHARGGTGLNVQTHAVEITPGCRIHQILEQRRIDGATSHHQAIRDVGRDLTAVGHSPEDGVIEAVEEPGERFVIGVQWHPEIHPDAEATRRLFAAFVTACADYARQPKLTVTR